MCSNPIQSKLIPFSRHTRNHYFCLIESQPIWFRITDWVKIIWQNNLDFNTILSVPLPIVEYEAHFFGFLTLRHKIKKFPKILLLINGWSCDNKKLEKNWNIYSNEYSQLGNKSYTKFKWMASFDVGKYTQNTF